MTHSQDEQHDQPHDPSHQTVRDLTRPTTPDGFLISHLAEETRQRARTARAPEAATAGADADLLDALREAVDELAPTLLEASHDLSAHPEVSFEEHRSAAALADLVEARGITVTREAHGLATGLRAEAGPADGPTIAVLYEYDALPGIGHGCGHNIIATAGLGAFLALASLGDRLPGRVVWLGTPAEEGGGGKEIMAGHGAFDDVDAALMVHPFTYDIAEPLFLGRRQLRATFVGTTRARSRGRDVKHLEYEAYEGMAEQVMAKLAETLRARHDLCAVAIHHRVGRVDIGDTSVVIAVSAPHRAAALTACHEAID